MDCLFGSCGHYSCGGAGEPKGATGPEWMLERYFEELVGETFGVPSMGLALRTSRKQRGQCG